MRQSLRVLQQQLSELGVQEGAALTEIGFTGSGHLVARFTKGGAHVAVFMSNTPRKPGTVLNVAKAKRALRQINSKQNGVNNGLFR
jgi:hypothetical protein